MYTERVINQVVISASGYANNTKQISVVAKVKTFRRATAGSKVEPYGEIIYRNSLLFLLFPQIDFAILQVPGTPPKGPGHPHDPNILNSFELAGKLYKLDMASGSRLAKEFSSENQDPEWGSFTFSDSRFKNGVGPLYFGLEAENRWKSIIYGSILHTGCKTMAATDIAIAITDDTLDGVDDPKSGIDWDTGDSHAKSSPYLHSLLKLNAEQLENPSEEMEYFVTIDAVQFRAAFQSALYSFNGEKTIITQLGIPGKGTFSYDSDFGDKTGDNGVNLAVPLSCLKGNKLPLGVMNTRILIGTVFESEWRTAKTGWMLFQHFKWETLERDGIVVRMIEEGQKLAAAYNSITALTKLLRLDYAIRAQSSEFFTDEEEAIAQAYEDKFITIVMADRQGLLLGHPYILERLRERLRTRWLTLAKSGGIRFYSFMTMPDESLAHYNVWDDEKTKQFCIDGRVCCCPELAEGKYILFVNPMRSWGDVQVWENKHEGKFINTQSRGIIAAPTALFLTLGRDFDGDFVQIMHCDEYPAMTEAIESFNQPPKVRKLPKEKLTGDIRAIALNSMSNYAGLVAWLSGITIAHGYSYMPFVVPVGGIWLKEEEVTVIEFLSQELQIAVDSIKSATPNNKAGIDKLMAFYKERNMAIAWQAGFKNSETYSTITCPVDDDATDTISRMVQVINSLWREAKLPQSVSPKSFRTTLFEGEKYNTRQETVTKTAIDNYRKLMASALEHKRVTGTSKKLTETLLHFKEVKQKILAEIDPETGNPYTSKSWASAFWFIAHTAETGSAGSVFNFFLEEVVAELEARGVIKYHIILVLGIQYGGWTNDFLYSLACTKTKPENTVNVRFARGMSMVSNPKKEIPKGSGNWEYERDENGERKKSPKFGDYAHLEIAPDRWQVLGAIAGSYVPNLPSMPAGEGTSEVMEMKLFLFPSNKNGDFYKALLLPGKARYPLGVAEITNVVNNNKTSIAKLFWYMWWLSDMGVEPAEIMAQVPEWDSSEMFKFANANNLDYPPGVW